MQNLLSIGTILTTALLVGGCMVSRQWSLALLVLGFGAFWLVGQRQGWDDLASPVFLALVSLASLGIYWGASPFWLFLGTVAALATWDLSHFTNYLAQAEEVEAETALHQGHLNRLGLTVILSLLLGGIALVYQTEINFGAAVFLSLFLALSLGLAVRFVRRGI
jgi:hypothetical protein